MRDTPTSTLSKIIKIVLIIVIPLLFITTTTWVILKWSGYPPAQTVTSWANELPLIGAAIPDNKAANGTKNRELLVQKNGEQVKTIESLEAKLKAAEDEIGRLHEQMEAMELKYEQKLDEQKQQKKYEKQEVIAQTYENITPATAATIFSKMTLEEAASYMNLLNNEKKAAILEAMDPKTAANMTPLLKAPPSAPEQTE